MVTATDITYADPNAPDSPKYTGNGSTGDSQKDNLYNMIQSIKSQGNSSAAGTSAANNSASVVTAQYPAARVSGNDSGDSRLSDLYENGLIFKAYDYNSRSTVDLTSQRQTQQTSTTTNSDLISVIKAAKKAIGRDSTTENKVDKSLVCNILMPRSKSDADSVSHKFNDVQESRITKGGGTITGILSNMASTAVYGTIESITGGLFADHNEQLYNASRSMYAGADNRSKTYVWDLTPRTVEDLKEIIKIYEYFTYYSYGEVGGSQYAKEIKKTIDENYQNTLKKLTPDGSDTSNSMMESITSFLSNVIVVSNPTIWFIENFGDSSSLSSHKDVFGPAQIQSVRLDKAPEGNFNPLSIAPNLPSSFQLEITMREIMALNRHSLYGVDL